MIVTQNNLIACTPLASTAVKVKQHGSLQLGDFGAGGDLIKLTTVADALITKGDVVDALPQGAFVYLRGDCVQHAWAKALCTSPDLTQKEIVDGKEVDSKVKFILVPLEQVVAVGKL